MNIPFDTSDLVVITAVISVGAACQATIGMGLNLLAIPLLLLINPIFAPGPVLAASCMLSVLAFWKVPAKINVEEFKFALTGLILGTILAALTIAFLDSESLARALGALVVVGVVLAFSGWSVALNSRNLLLAGSGAGFLGTVAGVHAPPIALVYQGLEPARVRGAILSLIGVGNLLSIIALAVSGYFGHDQIVATLFLLPGVFLGLLLSTKLTKAVDSRSLRMLVLLISAISGLVLVFR